MRCFLHCVALVAALAGCGDGAGDGGNGLAAVRPSQVAAADLQAAVGDGELRRFYEARGWQPAWTAETAEALVGALEGAARHGLDPRSFLAALERAPAPAAREVALSRAALDLAETLARGRTDPRELYAHYTLPRPRPDLVAGLAEALNGGDLARWLDGLAPQDAEYRALSDAFVAASRRPTPSAAIPDGPALRPGGADPRLPRVAAALQSAGYLAGGGEPATADRPALVEAVRSLQRDYGLEADGIVRGDTLAALNDAAIDRAQTLAVALERRRWLPRDAAPTRIDVNIAAATLVYWQDGAAVDSRRVIVGEPGNETPQLASPLYRLVANPTWTVPRSIQREEIEPRGAGYMAENDMEWRDGWIVQRSGPRNALGLVKFDMRNDEAIYLHDTPHKALFGEAVRQFSHGCVRVADALGLARMIADRQGISEQWARATLQRDETFVALPRPIPVRLLYRTAFLDGDRIRFRLDAYGWDDPVARALGYPARPRPERAHLSHDPGP